MRPDDCKTFKLTPYNEVHLLSHSQQRQLLRLTPTVLNSTISRIEEGCPTWERLSSSFLRRQGINLRLMKNESCRAEANPTLHMSDIIFVGVWQAGRQLDHLEPSTRFYIERFEEHRIRRCDGAGDR
jgi:hypothetical protein